MLFAEAIPSAMDWKGFGIVCLFLLTAGEKLGLWRFLRGPEKREVSFAAQHPSKEEFRELGQKVENIESYGALRRKAIYERMEKLQSETGGQLASLHEKINGVSQDVAEMAGKVEMIRTDMVHLIHGRKG
jgi:hypothetical protein